MHTIYIIVFLRALFIYIKEIYFEASKITQQVKVVNIKPDNMSSIHMVEQLLQAIILPAHAYCSMISSMCTCLHTYQCN